MTNLEPRRARWIRVRLALLVGLLCVGFTRLVIAAYTLQVRDGNALRAQALQQYSRPIELTPRRGTLYDRHHNPLAVSVATFSLSASPRRLSQLHADLEVVSSRLAAALSMPPAEVRARLADPRSLTWSNRGFVWIKRLLSTNEVTAAHEVLRSLHLRHHDGLDFVEESRRWYPNRELAAHLLGFVGSEGHGLEGLERSLDDHLRGRTYALQGLRDARGNLVLADGITPGLGQAGDDVTLTLDATIQHIAERELALTCQVFEARGGSVIVTDPRTGEVLAMANYPTYNPNEFASYDPEARRNRAVTDRFEPGSTMKVFSVGGALDAGVVQPGQLINCYGGTYTIGDLTIHDAHPDTWLTPMQIIMRSSNIGAAQIGAALGSDGLERTFRRFGFGERTGLPLPGEARARFGERRWYEVEVATVAFGQGIGVTAIQMAQALGGVANGGRLATPFLVRRITDAMGSLVEEHGVEQPRLAMQPAVARLLSEMLTTVTEDGGTGVEAAIPGLRVAGKTGTAQKANEHGRGYDDSRWTSSFIGFVPADRPRVVITVVIDEPQIAHSGGTVAAPLFRRVAEQTLRYLGALPGGQAQTALPRPAVQHDREGTADVGPHGATSERSAARGTVPDLHGLTVRAALSALHAAGMDGDFTGSGNVVRQDPPAGSPAARRVRVHLEPAGQVAAPAVAASEGGQP